MLHPQNGDRIVAIDTVTSLHPLYNVNIKILVCQIVDLAAAGSAGPVPTPVRNRDLKGGNVVIMLWLNYSSERYLGKESLKLASFCQYSFKARFNYLASFSFKYFLQTPRNTRFTMPPPAPRETTHPPSHSRLNRRQYNIDNPWELFKHLLDVTSVSFHSKVTC